MAIYEVNLKLNIEASSEEEVNAIILNNINLESIVSKSIQPLNNHMSKNETYPLIIKGKGYTEKDIIKIGKHYASKFDADYSGYTILHNENIIDYECISEGIFLNFECDHNLFLQMFEELKTNDEKILQNIVAFSHWGNMYTYKETEDMLRNVSDKNNEILDFFEIQQDKKLISYNTYNINMEMNSHSIKIKDLVKKHNLEKNKN